MTVLLAEARDADPRADTGDGAEGALGRDGQADVLAEGDEQVVVADPVTSRQPRAQRHLGLLGRHGSHIAPAVRDPVDVDVHADAGLVIGLGHDQIGGLAPDALERQQVVDRVGHPAAEALEEIAGDLPDDTRLGAVETNGEDGALDLARREAQDAGRGVREREEPRGRGSRGFVLGAEREEAGDEDVEGVAPALGDLGQRGLPPAGRLPTQPPDQPSDVSHRMAGGYDFPLMDSSSSRARLESFMVQSARLVGAFSSSTASSSRRASGRRLFLMSVRARPTRARGNFGSSSRTVLISCLTVGRRKSERITPLVWPQRAVFVPYQKWAWALFGASSTARFAASRPCSYASSFSSGFFARTSPKMKHTLASAMSVSTWGSVLAASASAVRIWSMRGGFSW